MHLYFHVSIQLTINANASDVYYSRQNSKLYHELYICIDLFRQVNMLKQIITYTVNS